MRARRLPHTAQVLIGLTDAGVGFTEAATSIVEILDQHLLLGFERLVAGAGPSIAPDATDVGNGR